MNYFAIGKTSDRWRSRMKALLLLVVCASAGALAQTKLPDGGETRWESSVGKFSIVPPKGFPQMEPVEQTGKTNNDILRFSYFDPMLGIAKGFIQVYENPKGISLDAWCIAEQIGWLKTPGYRENTYKKVKFLDGEAQLHVFRFNDLDASGHAKDFFVMKSIRLMHKGRGFWLVFYCTPGLWEKFVPRFDRAMESIKWLD